jgi:thioredoxin-like negative regulator of GroEL
MSEIIEIEGKEQFERTVVESDVPCIVDFWAPGCGPCLAMETDFTEASKRFEGKVRFVRVNTQSNEDVAGIMRIRSVPTLVAFRGPVVYDIRAGRTSMKGIVRMAQRVLDKEQGVGFFGRLKRFFTGA